MLNLCINGRDAMPDGGVIVIETGNATFDGVATGDWDLPPGDYVTVSMSDDGTGMPPDIVARAFDPFFTTKPIGQGTGLGLSMSYGFARQSGGQVRISSEVGMGTRLLVPAATRRTGGSKPRPGQFGPPFDGREGRADNRRDQGACPEIPPVCFRRREISRPDTPPVPRSVSCHR